MIRTTVTTTTTKKKKTKMNHRRDIATRTTMKWRTPPRINHQTTKRKIMMMTNVLA